MRNTIAIILVVFVTDSRFNDVTSEQTNYDCNANDNSTATNGSRRGCPAFSHTLCPTKCDPSCQRPLIKRTMCRQPITCPKKECVCHPDYVKDHQQNCIPTERCSEICGSDEVYKLCPSSCEIHCGNVDNPPKSCPEDEREDHECIAGCVCPTGLIRDYSTGKCVSKDGCSQMSLVSCPPDQEYRHCSTTCDRVCNKNTTCEVTRKCEQGCFCKPGFIRLNTNANCIPEDKCKTLNADRKSPKFS